MITYPDPESLRQFFCESPPQVSFEFFPPKTKQGEDNLWRTIVRLEPLQPQFVGVTYGAGGSRSKKTVEIASYIQNSLCIPALAHMTCVGSKKEDIDRVADSLKQSKPFGPWHPENWQTYYHIENWRQLQARPYLWSTFIWNMFDFAVSRRREGYDMGRNDKGLVTYDRKIRKDAFYFYKANWNRTEPFVHIVDKRHEVRNRPIQTIRVFSNQRDVELFVNGQSQGLHTNDSLGRFVWEKVQLRPGENTIEAVEPMHQTRDRAVIVIREELLLPSSSLSGGTSRSTSTTRLRPSYRQ